MKAFHGDPAVKQKYLDRVAAHRAADELIQGIGWEDGKGCAIGCTLDAYDHDRYETELGIPLMLARLEDRIFEGLSNGEAQQWPTDFLEAIEPGADLSLVGWKFLHWLIGDPGDGVIRFADDDTRPVIQWVIDILALKASGGDVDGVIAARAARAAGDAAAYATYAAARATTYAADAAGDAAGDAAAYAAYAAARAADAAAAYQRQSAKLLELLREA